jgi:hypothetical protein
LQLDSDAKHVAEVERILRDGRYAVVVADPLYKLHTGDSNAEREAVELMRRLDRWRDELGFGLVLPVHLRKPIPGVKFSIHEIFGSSAYVRGAEVVLGLRRVSNGFAELHFFKDRDGDLPVGEKWALLFDRETGFRRAQEEDDEAALADRLLDFVRENPGLSTKKVTAQVKGRKKTLTRILRTDDRFESRRRGQADLWYEATTERLFPGDGNPPEHPSPAEPGNPVPDGGASPVGTAPTGTGSDQVVPAEPEHPSDGGEVKGA